MHSIARTSLPGRTALSGLREAWALLKATFSHWYADNTFQLGAALAYYTVFSIAPVVIIAIGIAGVIFGQPVAREQILDEIQMTIGPSAARAVAETIDHANMSGTGVAATAIGILVLLFGASSVFVQLQESLNAIWGVKASSRRSGLWYLVRDRLLSFGMVLGIGFLLMVSLVVSSLLAALGKYLTPDWLSGSAPLWQLLNWLLSFGVITLLFAMIYKVLPDVHLEWRDVATGALVTALLFTTGKYLIALYLGRSSVASAYGAAGSLVLLLLWVYYSSQIFLMGAEFTRVYADWRGKPIHPARGAVTDTTAPRAPAARDAR